MSIESTKTLTRSEAIAKLGIKGIDANSYDNNYLSELLYENRDLETFEIFDNYVVDDDINLSEIFDKIISFYVKNDSSENFYNKILKYRNELCN